MVEFLKQAAHDAGFDLAGIAPVGEFPELAYFARWIAEKRAGEMRYLEARDEQGELKRASLARVAPWARSVIVCAMNYNRGDERENEKSASEECSTMEPPATPSKTVLGRQSRPPCSPVSRGWISRYAWSKRDYHDVLMEALRMVERRVHELAQGVQTRCYVDTGPLVERVFARFAGLGWIGKNTCLINQRLGSWLFLGVVLTSLELPPELPPPDRCGTCRRCLDACPTNAFVAPHELDATRCISYLTIEKRGEIPEELRAGVGRNVLGCDICQDVCPWNLRAPVSLAPDFAPRPGLVNPDLKWLATISEAEFREVFRNSPVKRSKRSGMRRNAVVAMGNSGDRAFESCLVELTRDDDEIVAAHARWALERLRSVQSAG